MAQKIIIDTDPGVDDALAIALAVSSNLSVIALTSVYGNIDIVNTTRNGVVLLETLGSKIPVYKGASGPVCGKAFLAEAHGDNGLGGYTIAHLTRTHESASAIEFMIHTLESAQKGEVTIVAMGPTTNVSLLYSMRPDLVAKIDQLVIMGGVFDAPGNVSPVAEFNVMNDPYALANILQANCKKVIIPANVCRTVLFKKSDFDAIKSEQLRHSLNKIIDAYIGYYTSDRKHAGFEGGVMYDVLTIAYLLNPSLFSLQKADVFVETRAGETFGQTVKTPQKSQNTCVVESTDAEKLKNLFFSTVNSLQTHS